MDAPFPSPAQPAVNAAVTQQTEPAKPGAIEAVGPDVGDVTQNPLVTLPFTDKFIGEMWEIVERGTQMVKDQSEAWDLLLKEYTPTVSKSGSPEVVSLNKHFRNLHTKIGQLFLQNPEIRISDQPVGPTSNQQMSPMGQPMSLEDIISVKQELLNKKLGRDGIKANRLMDELLFDVLQTSGLGCCKIGHSITIRQVQEPVMGPDPNYVPPPPSGVLGLQPQAPPPMVPQIDPMTGQPMTRTVPVPIFEEDYIRRFSTKKLVLDPDLKSTRYNEDSGFIGMWWSMKPGQAARTFGKKEEELGQGEQDDKVFEHQKGENQKTNVIMGVELFIKASYIDPAVTHPNEPGYVCHPQELYQLVLLKGNKTEPLVWRQCVDQTFDEKGQLTENSLDRFPIQVLTIRDFSDSAFPKADAAFTNTLIKTQNTSRSQQIKLRDATIPKILYVGGRLEDNDVSKIRNGAPGDWIELEEGALDQGADKVMAPTPTATLSPDLYRLDSQLDHEIDATLGISSNSAGATNDTVRAATEIAATQQGAAARNQKEQSRVIDFYLDLVRLLDIYICRYTKQQQYLKIVGQEGMNKIVAWNGPMLSGRWLYDIAPDSQLRVDTAQDRQQNLGFYNLVAKDPLVDRAPILRRLARQFGYDPAKIIINPMLMQSQPPHGGEVSKHATEQSGGRESQPGAENQSENQRQLNQPEQE